MSGPSADDLPTIAVSTSNPTKACLNKMQSLYWVGFGGRTLSKMPPDGKTITRVAGRNTGLAVTRIDHCGSAGL